MEFAVRSPRGFGKKYFTFSSILAHSVAQKLHSLNVSLQTYEYFNKYDSSKQEEDSPPEEELLLCSSLQYNKPCHCDCFFKRKTNLAIKLFKFIPRCPYYNTFFAFRRTGVHPPQL